MLDKLKKYSWIIKAIMNLSWSAKKEVVTHFLTAKKKYLPDKKTKANVSDILKCGLCPNMCRFDCPVLQAAKSETVSPSGKARIAYLMEMKRLTFCDAVNLMYKCCDCDACKEWCPFTFSVGELLQGVRRDVVEKGLVPPLLVKFKEDLVKKHTVYEATSLGLEREGDILYFAGCTTLNKTREIADALVKIMERAQIDFAVLPEEWCCGAPLSILGFDKDFTTFAKHNAAVIRKGGYRTLVCSCPECVYMFKDVYPRIGLPLGIEVLHTSQFLLRLVREGKIKLKLHKKEYVYHDPCTLARKLNIYEEPRELLNIQGLNLKEPYFNKKETRCCGMGGLLSFTNPEISSLITENTAAYLKERGSSVITACPTCKKAFQRMDLEVRDITEVILNSVEEKNG